MFVLTRENKSNSIHVLWLGLRFDELWNEMENIISLILKIE